MKTARDPEPSRLIDEAHVASGDAVGGGIDPWAVDLLRAAGPYRAPPGRKQRVQLSLGKAASRRPPRLLLRPVIVAGVLVGGGAFASAALGHWPGWMTRAYERLLPRPTQVAKTSFAEARGRGHRAEASLAEAAPPAGEMPAPPATLAPGPVAAALRDPPASPRQRRMAVAAAPEETSDVLDAMRALRKDRNPVRARVLLARYLDRHPAGTLAEEALAMSIEAAVAHHDADAAALGARYLRLYPTGPFHALAVQTQR
jgi:hypothetical protein